MTEGRHTAEADAMRAFAALALGITAAAALAGCIVGAFQRRRLLRALNEGEARFHNIIERTADGIVIVGPDRRVRFVNPAAERLFGRSATELLDHDFGIPVVAGETAEMDVVRQNGSEPAVAELRVSDTTWAGEPAQLVSLRDVTDRKRADERAQRLVFETAAREQAEKASRRARFVAEASTVLDASLDPQATLRSIAELIVPRLADWCVIDLLEGDRFRRVAAVHADAAKQPLLDELRTAFAPSRDSPQPAANVVRSGSAALYRRLDAQTVRRLAVDDAHARLLLEIGVRSAITVPLRVRDRTLGTITFVCTEREFDEADVALGEEIAGRAGQALENARLYEAAVASNQAKADFLAVMSHELRTPLNAILGYCDILLTGITGELADGQGRYLQRIRSSATQLLQIIEEILTFSSMEAGREEILPQEVTMRELIRDVAAVAQPLAQEKELDFRLHVDPPDAALFTDAEKLRRILLNLLTNAVKFTRQGAITLNAELHDDALVATVADTGVGIAPEHLESIFQPFWQAEQSLTRQAGGTGLGLSVSRRLARLLGGSITVDSTPGVGSTFTVRVPVRLPAATPGTDSA